MSRMIARGLIAAASIALAASLAQAQTRIKVSAATMKDTTEEWTRLFREGVEKRSGGKLKVEYYPANQLGNIPSTVEGVALGTIEAVMVATGFYVALEPRFGVFDIPGLFEDTAQAARVFDDPEIRKRLQDFGKSKGVETAAIFAHAPMMILSHKPINTVADLAGQKIRVPGGAPLHVEPARAMGVSPLSMPLGEVLPAMQNRSIDGFYAGATVFPTFKYFDVAKTLTYVPSSMLILPVLMNTRFIDSLGPEMAKIVREEARNAERNAVQWTVDDVKGQLGVWANNGGRTIHLPPEEQKKYIATVEKVLPPIFAKNPAMKEDYEAFLAAVARTRTK